jgi:hypothetical protein
LFQPIVRPFRPARRVGPAQSQESGCGGALPCAINRPWPTNMQPMTLAGRLCKPATQPQLGNFGAVYEPRGFIAFRLAAPARFAKTSFLSNPPPRPGPAAFVRASVVGRMRILADGRPAKGFACCNSENLPRRLAPRGWRLITRRFDLVAGPVGMPWRS